MVLQRVELEGEVSSSHFWIFGSLAALMGKHGFAEKLHLKLNWLLIRPEHIQHIAVRTPRNIRIAVSELEKNFPPPSTVEYHMPKEHRKVGKDQSEHCT